MKKIITVIALIFLIGSCGTPKTVIQSKKVIKGAWTLNNVTLSEYGTFKISFFNDADKVCFEGSTWQFVPNNNTGIYTINNDNCIKGERNFIFTIQEINSETGLYDFLLKPTNEKHKSTENKGYRVRLAQLSDTSMQWVQTVSIDGKEIKVNMNFTKN